MFAANYSDSLVERTEAGQFADDWTLEASDVAVTLDMSSEYNIKLSEGMAIQYSINNVFEISPLDLFIYLAHDTSY